MSLFFKPVIRHLNLFLSLLFFFIGLNHIKATHIVGGVLSYNVLYRNDINGQEAYRVKFKMYVYRDAINGQAGFDNPAYFTIFKKTGAAYTFHSNETSYNPIVSTVPMQLTNPCLVLPPNIRVQEGIYDLEVTLPYNEDGYQISYQRCCRNGTISNLLVPSDEGATYTIEITGRAMRILNSSPIYDNFPPIAICQNQLLEFDHKATDAQGHRLSYSFCTPLHGANQLDPAPPLTTPPPYRPVGFRTPYNPAYPVSSAQQPLTLDAVTGFLTGIPDRLGQFVVGICVTEYDADGVVLSQTLRDFQFNVAYCEPKVIALLEADSVSADSNHFYFNGCQSKNINFNNLSRDRNFITAYAWNFDNGFSATTMNPSLSISTPSVVNGILIANPNTAGCRDTAFIHINVAPRPVANFTSAVDSCNPSNPPIQFTNTSSVNPSSIPLTYSWNFGNNTNSTQQNPSVNYASPGLYSIRLVAKSNPVCSAMVVRAVEYYPPAQAAFDATPVQQCTPISTTFTNTTTFNSANYTYAWNFGDGTAINNNQNTTHTYTQVGSYTAVLTVTSPWGCVSQYSRQITALPKPTANFTYIYDTCVAGPITFASNSVGVSNNSIVSTNWDWGTGATATGTTATYEFENAGSFNVRLITQDANGCIDTLLKNIGYYPAPIIADFFSDPNLCERDLLDFSNTSSPVNNDYTFNWNFGDGGRSNLMNPSYQFNTVGTFNASLQIISPYGCRSTYSKVITVNERPKANLLVAYDSCQYTPVLITNNSSTNAAGAALTSQFLDLGNGNSVSNFSATHTEPFVVRNDYTLNLYIEDANTCKDTFSYFLNYFPSPVFDIPSHSQEACLPLAVNFTNNELNDYPGYSYEWQLGNGQMSSLFEPQFTYTERGTYYTSVRIISAIGCINTYRDTIIVRGVPEAAIAYAYDSCALEPVVFKSISNPSLDAPISTILWNFGDGNTSSNTIENHSYNYPQDTGIFNVSLTVSDRYGCQDDTTIAFKWAPYPIYNIALENSQGCLPLKVTLPTDFPYPINNYTYEWNFGDGNRSSAARLVEDYAYTTAGTFTRTFHVKAPNGCVGNYSSVHIAKPVPTADFIYAPNVLDIFNPEVSFTDKSIDAAMWEWHFGLNRIPDYRYTQHPTFMYRDTGAFVVQLVATHMNGCTDTLEKTLDIVPKFTYFLPNAFTPNSDGTNDGFRGTGLMQYIASFEMQIFNRWGEMVFKTNDPFIAWNGRKDNVGDMSQAGVYVVQVILKGHRGEEQVIKGFATLVH